MTINRHSAGLALVLGLAAVPRLAWYRSHQPILSPDAAGYLNVAREWRGERAPAGGWDDRAQLPWDNQAARTPGYPLFLDLVFAAAGHSATPEAALTGPRRVFVPGVGTGAREHHLKHLMTDENVRAVQAVQHGLGVVAAGVAYLTLVAWTSTVWPSVVGALVATGWNPIWITVFEPSVRTEILAGVLLLSTVWLLTRLPAQPLNEHLAATCCGLMVIVRPAMLFAALPVLCYLVWRERRRPLVRALTRLIAPVILGTLLILNNGLRYQYWGTTSVGAITLISHAAEHPEGLPEPLHALESRIRGNRFAGQAVLYTLMVEKHWSFRDATHAIQGAAVAYIFEHPKWYFASVSQAVRDFLSPPLRILPGDSNLVRQRAPRTWECLSGCLSVLLLSGFVTLFVRTSATGWLAPVIYLTSAIGSAMTAHTQNDRFAVPVNPLMLMSGVAALQGVWARLQLPARIRSARR